MSFFCLNLYSDIIGQRPNLTKSVIYLLTWFNNRVSKSISSLLGMYLGSFPFTYLGAPIFPLHLPASHFNFLPKRAQTKIKKLGATPLTPKQVECSSLIVVFSRFQPTTSLFFSFQILSLTPFQSWLVAFSGDRNNNAGGFHLIAWKTSTLSKSDGGLGLQNLRNVRCALLAKQIFALIDHENKFWVHIFHKKYPNWSLWDRNCTSNASWFYNSICKVADILKPNLKISVFNPNITNFFNDPWLLDLPLSHKPTYFNMNMVDNCSFTQIISENSFDLNACTELFGNNLDFDGISIISHEALENNDWIWWPTPTRGRLVATIYDHLNSFEESVNHWRGWRNIWGLISTPRIKMFI